MTIKWLDKLSKFVPRYFQSSKSSSTTSVRQIYQYAPTAFMKMSDPEVTVKQGKLKGAVKKLLNGSQYYSFKGIPYAETPVGKYRFMAPRPPQAWSGTLDATEHGPVCPQYDMVTRTFVEGDENCLFLNIYTKSIQPTSKLPVMVYVHGGAFMSGSGNSDTLGPEFLLQHDIILVTINYRLEVLGFLCLDTPEVPGNAGMKDQVYALRWVRDNIAQFGGDPDNVTLFGESAGGASVTYHMMSPMSKGLFHRAIAQSGVSICDWSQGKEGRARAFRLGKVLGKDTNDDKELLEFFRSLPAIKLSRGTMKSFGGDEKYRGLPIHFAPVVEKKFDNVEAFMTEEPLPKLLSQELYKVPLILGYNSEEGLVTLAEYVKRAKFFNENPQYLVPREIVEKHSPAKVLEIGKRVKEFYFNGKDMTENDKQKLATVVSDMHFVYNTQRFAHFYSSIESTYLYRFGFETELNIIKNNSIAYDLKGASHAEDLFYLFYIALNEEPYRQQERIRNIVYNVTKLWADFAKTGNPTPDNKLGFYWPPYKPSSRQFLDLAEPMAVCQYPDKERIDFWNKLYLEAGLPCITKSNL